MQMTPRRLAVATNYHKLMLPKCPQVLETHSWHELLYLSLCDLDPQVDEVESQPDRIRRPDGSYYFPDARIRRFGKDHFVEIKSQAGLESSKPSLEPLLSDFARKRNATYGFVSHEEIDVYAAKGFAWLTASRWVFQYFDHLDGKARDLHRIVRNGGEMSLEQVVAQHWGISRVPDVLACVCHLVHRGQLSFTNLELGFKMSTCVRVAPRRPPVQRDGGEEPAP